MTVKEVQQEVALLTADNIRSFPCDRSAREDFQSMWSRFGPEAARTIMIPEVWYDKCPRPSEYFNV